MKGTGIWGFHGRNNTTVVFPLGKNQREKFMNGKIAAAEKRAATQAAIAGKKRT